MGRKLRQTREKVKRRKNTNTRGGRKTNGMGRNSKQISRKEGKQGKYNLK